MAKLTGPEIERRIEQGQIIIDPFDPTHVNPNSVDLTLGPKLLVYDTYPSNRLFDNWANRGNGLENVHDGVARSELRRMTTPVKEHEHIELTEWRSVLDMKVECPTYELLIPEEGLVLVPGRLYLGSTAEYTETHGLVPCIEGRSSIGRLGMDIHSTAGFGDVGFCGTWTLEISVIEPLRVYPGVRVCQIHYDEIVGTVRTYDSKYQGQRDPRPSGIWKDFKEEA